MAMRPRTTLFMLMSVDGKISTGSTDVRDFDSDLPKILGVKEGLWQYYALEKRTDIVSLNTGRVMAKIGVNTRKDTPKKNPCTFVIIDNKPHLNKKGLIYLSKWTCGVILVTTNARLEKIANGIQNISVLRYKKTVDLKVVLRRLKTQWKIQRVTIQSGGTLNAALLRANLIDTISLVIAPALIGGENTPTLLDGHSLKTVHDLSLIRPLKLLGVHKLKNSYIHVVYAVQNR